jgi:hypothetical protein
MKSIFQSRTVWLAIVQAIAAIAIAVLTELDQVSFALVVKSIVDIYLRYETTEPLK